jgi:hypothetical protein
MSVTVSNELYKLISELGIAIQGIFELGFIPEEGDIVEFNEELYAKFRKQTNNRTRPMYTLATNNFEYLKTSKEMCVFDAKGVGYLKQGIAFFKKYAKENNLPEGDSDAILKFAAADFPWEMSKGTAYARPKEDTTKDQWMDFLAKTGGKDAVHSIKFTDDRGVLHTDVFSPGAELNFKGKKMDYDEFIKYAVEALSKIFVGERYRVVESVSQKTDEEAYDVIHVREKVNGVDMGRGFRVGPFYNDYSLGKPLGELVLEMVKSVEESEEWTKKIDLTKINEFETVRDVLIIRPLNYRRNQKMLKDFMFRRVGDIALVIYMLVSNENNMMATAKIARKSIESWNLPTDYIFDWGLENTARLFKPCILPAEAIIRGKLPKDYPAAKKYFMEPNFKLGKSLLGSYTLIVENSLNNATAVFYKGALKRLSELLNDDLYIVIASFDHAIVHKQSSISLDKIQYMAKKEKNNPYAKPEDFLSDNVYTYSRKDDTLTMVASE